MGHVLVRGRATPTTPVPGNGSGAAVPRRRLGGSGQGSGPWRKRILVAVTAVVGVGALGLGIGSDLQTRSALRQARSELHATRFQVARTLRTLSSVESNLLRTSGQRTVLQNELRTTTQELAAAQANLSSTQAGLSSADTSLVSQGIDIAVLNACLAGVEQALNQIAVGDNSGAVSSIRPSRQAARHCGDKAREARSILLTSPTPTSSGSAASTTATRRTPPAATSR